MKHYIYKLVSKPYNTGIQYTATVYRIVRNTPIYLGERNFDSASSKGANCEVFKFLYHTGEITKKYYDKHDGYYFRTETTKIAIMEI